MAEREAQLLPVQYFHIVYWLPAPIADIAYQNKRVIYDLLFKAAAETTIIWGCQVPESSGTSAGERALPNVHADRPAPQIRANREVLS